MDKKANQAGTRDSNIELLRIVLIFFIILHHFIVHGTGLKDLASGSYESQQLTFYYLFGNSFLVIGVNCFILISGFYGIKLKAATAISLVIQTSFYALLFFCLHDIFDGTGPGIITIKKALFPISRSLWWFMTAYFFLFLLSPLLNLAKTGFTKVQFAFVILVLFTLNCLVSFVFNPLSLGVNSGYSLVSFIGLYMVGQFMGTYSSVRIRFSLLIYIVCSLMIFVLAVGAFKYMPQTVVWRMFQYNNPLVVFSSIAFFSIFLNFSLRSKFVNYIAASVLGVYLIHEHPAVAEWIYPKIKLLELALSPVLYLLCLVGASVVLVFTCVAIEKFRSWLFKPLIDFLATLSYKYKLDIFAFRKEEGSQKKNS